ncbi:hypothetical protein F2Q68_00035928 [Brassica cretica]|uniref:Uncharacterized protein n=1 Tax=Brassica cretica TaxID=69181 RepID=A0A8S9GYS1_BRACR|nr:hypothetical protein F2Q68_00035928 [Brassica cretica]
MESLPYTKRRKEYPMKLWFLFFAAVLPAALPPWWVLSPVMSREGSLTTAVLFFSRLSPLYSRPSLL